MGYKTCIFNTIWKDVSEAAIGSVYIPKTEESLNIKIKSQARSDRICYMKSVFHYRLLIQYNQTHFAHVLKRSRQRVPSEGAFGRGIFGHERCIRCSTHHIRLIWPIHVTFS